MPVEAIEAIPLREAVYCQSCSMITRAKNGHCPACSGPGVALLRLSQVLPSIPSEFDVQLSDIT